MNPEDLIAQAEATTIIDVKNSPKGALGLIENLAAALKETLS